MYFFMPDVNCKVYFIPYRAITLSRRQEQLLALVLRTSSY